MLVLVRRQKDAQVVLIPMHGVWLAVLYSICLLLPSTVGGVA